MMKRIFLGAALLTALPSPVLALTPIDCTNQDPKHATTSIWPKPYLSDAGLLCFDVKAWPEYSGSNCVANGKSIRWTGLVIVWEDGESRGRDSTDFRVNKPLVSETRIDYTIEWSRGEAWRPMQHVSINRLTGVAVSHFVQMQGGETYQCRAGKKAL